MVTILRYSDLVESAWRNSQGTTRQMAIYPERATLEEDNFLWRISSATIRGSGLFSQFPSCYRHLIVWKGSGLSLNQVPFESPLIKSFSGEEKIYYEVCADSFVADLGIIYKKNLIKSSMTVLNHSKIKTYSHNAQWLILFVAKSNGCTVNSIQLVEGDSLMLTNENNYQLSSREESQIIQISIDYI